MAVSIASNWSAEVLQPGWEGIGYSTIYERGGRMQAMATATRGSTIVWADLEIRR